ncbi:papilin [Drosophila madeirensis]|uniref:Papilin n=1 Tax=Drosophila madeirensis TaxID=30013 RepID=A0AAU9FFY1_DROMD
MDTKSNDDSAGSDSLDKSMQIKCVMVETTSDAMATGPTVGEESDNCSRDSAARDMGDKSASPSPTGAMQREQQAEQKTDAVSSMGDGDSSSQTGASSNCSSNTSPSSIVSCTAFETKVKQISQNLKETTLAEPVAKSEPTTSDAAASDAATSDAATSDTVTSDAATSDTATNDAATSDAVSAAAGDSSSSLGDAAADTESHNSTDDSSERRVKKVRFHPDVKENDGGTWAKKKRSPQSSEADSSANCDGMDLDEDEECDEGDEEPEEEFDMAKTIAEAEDYLKEHPLTFVRRAEQNGDTLNDGFDTIDDMPPVVPKEPYDNDVDFYRKIEPENGIERVLGRETKAGKVEYLLRYENQGGLFWESEEFIRRMCPTLLKEYEKNRERRQQRLMHHVAKRQTMRQRYTDF